MVEAQPVVRWSTRVSRPLDRYVPSLDYVMVIDCKEPSCYKEAMLKNDKLKWEKATQSEIVKAMPRQVIPIFLGSDHCHPSQDKSSLDLSNPGLGLP